MPTSTSHTFESASEFVEHLLHAEDIGDVTRAVRKKLNGVTVDNCALLIAAHVVDFLSVDIDGNSVLAAYDFPAEVIEEAAALVHASTLLRSALTHHETDTNPRLLTQLAGYLGTPLMVEWCRILTGAHGTFDEDQYLALINVTTGVQAVLAHPELIDGNDASLDALRRREASGLTVDPNVQARISDAPSTYVLSHRSEVIARHTMLAEPAVQKDNVRVRVYETHTPHEWLIDLVTYDMPGLLARITATLTSLNMDIVTADLATWPDDTVIDTFVVKCEHKPDERHLAEEIEQSFKMNLVQPNSPAHKFTVHYNDNILPWHTVVTVTGRDQHGALKDIAAAFAGAGISVHHAHISGDGTMMTDRFEVSDLSNNRISHEQRAQFEMLLNGH